MAVIEPLTHQSLPDVAGFLHAFSGNHSASAPDVNSTKPEQRLARLRWRLLENPFRKPEDSLGQLLIDAGRVVGCHLVHPFDFHWQGQRIRIGFSSDFFVDESVRGQGLFMFRQFLADKSFDVHAASTANSTSARLWEITKGTRVAGTNTQFTLPLKAAPLAREVLIRRQVPAAFTSIVSAAGPIMDLVPRLLRPRLASSESTPQVTDDWETIAAAASAMPGKWAKVIQDTKYFEWTYGQVANSSRSRRLMHFRGESGDVWFGVENQRIGASKQIRSLRVLDVIAAGKVVEGELLGALVAVSGDADVITMMGRPDRQLTGSRLISKRKFAHSTGYLISRAVDCKELAAQLVIADADRI